MAKIHQIFYSEETKFGNDEGFIPLNNLANERPDWREYWVIKKYLKNEDMDPECFYGFFSPKFKEKTGLSSHDVHQFIEKNKTASVCTFSPFFDQSALFINTFEQSNWAHPGTINAYSELLNLLNINEKIEAIVMHSMNTVYCNYFVAKPQFWHVWLAHCEMIFNLAESGGEGFSSYLNSYVSHFGGDAPLKVFLIERMVSLLLYLNKWDVKACPPSTDSLVIKELHHEINDLYYLDAMKIAYAETNNVNYLKLFFEKRGRFFRI